MFPDELFVGKYGLFNAAPAWFLSLSPAILYSIEKELRKGRGSIFAVNFNLKVK